MAVKNQTTYTNLSVDAIREEANSVVVVELSPVMVFLGILALFGGLGNLLACFIYYFRLQMSTQHFLIISLAAFDLLTCFLAIPFEINDLNFYFKFSNEPVCKVMRFLTHFCNFASILTLLVIAIDRYKKVCRPLKPQMIMSDVKRAVTINVLIALVLAIPPTIIYGRRTTETFIVGVSGSDCSTRDDLKDTVYPLLYNTFLFVAFIVLTIVLVVLYSQIWREMRRHSLYMARNSDAMKSSLRTERSSVSEGAGITVHDLPQEHPPAARTLTSTSDSFSAPSARFHKNPHYSSTLTTKKVADSSDRASSDVDLMPTTLQNDIQVKGQGRENGAFRDEEDQSTMKGRTGSDVDTSLMEIERMLASNDASRQVDSDDVFNDTAGEDGPRLDENRAPGQLSLSARRQANSEEENMRHNSTCGRDDVTCEQCGPRDGRSVHVSTPDRQCRCNRTSSDSVCSCDKKCVTNRKRLSWSTAEEKIRSQSNSDKIVTISERCDYRREDRPMRVTLFRRLASYLGTKRKASEQSAKFRVNGTESLRSFRVSSAITTRATRKATIIAFSITAVFILSFLPHLSLLTARIVSGDFDKELRGASLVFYNIFLRSYFVNSASNPIIYGVLNARFRAEGLALICYLLTLGRKQVEVSDSLSQ